MDFSKNKKHGGSSRGSARGKIRLLDMYESATSEYPASLSRKISCRVVSSSRAADKTHMDETFLSDSLPDFCNIEYFYDAAYKRLQILQSIEELSAKMSRTDNNFVDTLSANLHAKKLRKWISTAISSDSSEYEERCEIKKVIPSTYFAAIVAAALKARSEHPFPNGAG